MRDTVLKLDKRLAEEIDQVEKFAKTEALLMRVFEPPKSTRKPGVIAPRIHAGD